jgi:hypothetical protein
MGQPQFPEHGPPLSLMALHALQDVVQGFYRLSDVGAFVKHHAFRSVRHDSV